MSDTVKNSRIPDKRIIISLAWPYMLAILVFATVRIAIKNDVLVEKYYSEGLYPSIAKLFSALSNLVPFSLWDSFWGISILVVLAGLILSILKKIKFIRYFLRVTQLLALFYSLFYLLWGFNYFRPEITTRLKWTSNTLNDNDFRSVLDSLILNTNRSFTRLSVSEYTSIDTLVENSYKNNSDLLGIRYPNGKRRTKKMLFSSYFAKSGISGYFGPFFNEVHLNNYLLPEDYPFLLAHEKAHQFGISNEAEANLTAFIICTTSDDQRLQYSGYLFLLLYFINDASHLSDYKEYIRKIDKPVIDYIRFRDKYYDDLQNKTLEKVQSAANNVYLKSNNIKSGIENYNQVVALVIRWYQNSGHRIVNN
jgi:hypothetical protein